jgi:ACT domain-containing protein
MNAKENNRIVVTVLGEDKVGIVANMTAVLAKYNANIIDISQSLLQDLFSMIMMVDISNMDISFETLQNELETAGNELELKVMVQHEDVFRYMHRI